MSCLDQPQFKPGLCSKNSVLIEFFITGRSREQVAGGGRADARWSPAVPAVWGTSDVFTGKVMGSSVKIMASAADNGDSSVNRGVVADV